MLCQPGDGLLDKLCDIAPIGNNHGLLFQSVMKIHMLGLRDGVLEIVVVVREAGIRLNLADAEGLQDGGYRHAMVYETLI